MLSGPSDRALREDEVVPRPVKLGIARGGDEVYAAALIVLLGLCGVPAMLAAAIVAGGRFIFAYTRRE